MPVSSDITLSKPYLFVETQPSNTGIAVAPLNQTRDMYAYIRQINSDTTDYAEGDLVMFDNTSISKTFTINDIQYSVIREDSIIFKEVLPP